MPDWVFKLLDSGGTPIIVFVIWFFSQKAWATQQSAESQKWEHLMRIESDKWTKNFDHMAAESLRRHELFSGLIDNNSAQTGLMATTIARLEKISDTQEQMGITLREGLRSYTEELRIIHQRLNQIPIRS